jgi:hypothetical protein
VRTTSPPVQPLDPATVVRGAAPAPEQVGQRFDPAFNPPPPPPLPSGFGGTQPAATWQPVTVRPIPAAPPPVVQLLPPQFEPQPAFPVGFPR